MKRSSVKTCLKAGLFGLDLLALTLADESDSSTTLTILTRYTDSDIRHELRALVLTSLIYRSTVSRMPFISSFTVLRHDLRRIRMRNDGMRRIARASLARPLSSLPSFLPSSHYGFPSRECISPVIFSSTVARCRERMLQRTPLTRLRRKSSCRGCFRLSLNAVSR